MVRQSTEQSEWGENSCHLEIYTLHPLTARIALANWERQHYRAYWHWGGILLQERYSSTGRDYVENYINKQNSSFAYRRYPSTMYFMSSRLTPHSIASSAEDFFAATALKRVACTRGMWGEYR